MTDKTYDWANAFDAIVAAMARCSGDIAVSEAERQGLAKQGPAAEAETYQDKIRKKTLGDVTLEFKWHCYDPSHAYRAFPDVNVLSLELRQGGKVLRRAERRYED
jgi:hypothetical protein